VYRELKSFGLTADAINVLKSFTHDDNNAWLTMLIAEEYHDLEHTSGEVGSLANLVANDSVLRELVPWQRLFPAYRRSQIEQLLAELKVTISPLLIQAIIRQESAFDKSARSTANAQGLMQLTAGTANDVARQISLDKFSLTDERDNMRLGIHLFSSLLQKYGNRIDFALAAYNAGEKPTDQWIALRGHLPPTQFVESIPFPETRIYIKSIFRNYAIYRMLYNHNNEKLVSFNVD
jgi:soluble lytic murein transglycosylase-like protein